MYLHSDRPLISANGTSTLLHEARYTSQPVCMATGGADWIVEGIAEYYSLELLRRSNTISERRYKKAFDNARKVERGDRSASRPIIRRARKPRTRYS